MGREQFTTPPTSIGDELAVRIDKLAPPDSYSLGDGFDFDGSNYPHTVNPSFIVRELIVLEAGDVTAEIETTGGSTVNLPLGGASVALDHFEIESVTFRDPNGTGARLTGAVAGGT